MEETEKQAALEKVQEVETSSLFRNVHPNISLGVTAFRQETDYYCGPATAKQIINYINNIFYVKRRFNCNEW